MHELALILNGLKILFGHSNLKVNCQSSFRKVTLIMKNGRVVLVAHFTFPAFFANFFVNDKTFKSK